MQTYSFKKTSWRVIVPTLTQYMIWFFTHTPLAWLLRLEKRGLVNAQNIQGPLIFAPNHASKLDPILVRFVFGLFWYRSPMFYVADTMERYTKNAPLLNRLFFKISISPNLGAYAFTPGKKDYAKALALHTEILKSGRSLCIFPSGGIKPTNEPQEARGGLGFLAYTTGATVIPVGIGGLDFFRWENARKKKVRAHITFGKPVVIKKDEQKAQSRDACRQLSQDILDQSLTLAHQNHLG